MAFIDISKDAMVVSMGGVYNGAVSNVFSINYNPAVIANIHRKEINLSYGVFPKDLRHMSAVYGCPLKQGAIGAAVNFFDEEYERNGNLHNLIGVISYAHPIYDEKYFLRRRQIASIGINVKIINKNLPDDSKNIFAVDLGVLYRWPFDRGLNLGLAFRNIGGEYKISNERKRLPSSVELNISKSNFVSGLNLAVNGGVLFDENMYLNLGAEYNLGEKVFNFKDLFVRIGFSPIADNGTRIAAGLGVKFNDLSLDYGIVSKDKANPSFNIISLGHRYGYIKEDPNDIESLYRSGKKHYLQGNLMYARQKFEKVRMMSKGYKKTKQYVEQIRKVMLQLKKPLEGEKLHRIKRLMESGNKFLDEKKYNEAVNYYRAVLVIDENSEKAKEKIQYAKQKINEIKQKEKKERRAAKIKEMDKRISMYYNRGLRYCESKKYEQALSQYRKGKSLITKSIEKKWKVKFNSGISKTNKKLAETFYEQGYIYYQQNKLEEAEKKLIKAMNYAPRYTEAKEKLKEVREKMIQINRKRAERLYEQGMDDYTIGNMTKAVELWEKVLKYDPNHVEAKKALERVKARKGGIK